MAHIRMQSMAELTREAPAFAAKLRRRFEHDRAQREAMRVAEAPTKAQARQRLIQRIVATPTTVDRDKLKAIAGQLRGLVDELSAPHAKILALESVALALLLDAMEAGAFSDVRWRTHKHTLTQYLHFGTWAQIIEKQNGGKAKWSGVDQFVRVGCPVVADAIMAEAAHHPAKILHETAQSLADSIKKTPDQGAKWYAKEIGVTEEHVRRLFRQLKLLGFTHVKATGYRPPAT